MAGRSLSLGSGVSARNFLISWAKSGHRAKLLCEQVQGVRKRDQRSSYKLGVILGASHGNSFSSVKIITVLTKFLKMGTLEMRNVQLEDGL